jgi:hypothetical protein
MSQIYDDIMSVLTGSEDYELEGYETSVEVSESSNKRKRASETDSDQPSAKRMKPNPDNESLTNKRKRASETDSDQPSAKRLKPDPEQPSNKRKRIDDSQLDQPSAKRMKPNTNNPYNYAFNLLAKYLVPDSFHESSQTDEDKLMSELQKIKSLYEHVINDIDYISSVSEFKILTKYYEDQPEVSFIQFLIQRASGFVEQINNDYEKFQKTQKRINPELRNLKIETLILLTKTQLYLLVIDREDKHIGCR